MRKIERFVLLIVLTSIISAGGALAAVTTPAKQALMIDFDSGAVLLSKNADEAMAPASMSKLMTVYMLMEQLKEGKLKLDDELPVSKKAWKMGGSKMFVKVDTQVKISDLLRGIIVQSGNDACIVVAEGISGTEEDFADDMTEKAKKLGLTNSSFQNSSGWPDPDHYMSAQDLVQLSRIIIREFPQYYPIFAEREFTYREISQPNRNPLLFKKLGADGLKTGHTKASGYGLISSARRKGRRLILVVNGLTSVKERARESERLLNIGFRQFTNVKLFDAGETLGKAKVWLGDEEQVPLVLGHPLTATVPQRKKNKVKILVEYDSPVAAPIKKGQRIATLRIKAPGVADMTKPLLAARAVARSGPFGRIWPKLWRLVVEQQ